MSGETTLGELPRKGMLIIHGAGDWEENYWEAIANDVKQLIGKVAHSFAANGVFYADVTPPMTLAPHSPALNDFKSNFLNELVRHQLIAAASTLSSADLWKKILIAALPGGTGVLGALFALPLLSNLTKTPENFLDLLTRSLLGTSLDNARKKIEETVKPARASIASTIEDVYRYLYDDAFAQRIRQKFIAGLRDAQQYPEIVLVSHSLGTIIAFDVLNEWNEPAPKISHWFTLGCPLTKVLRLRPSTPNELKNPNVTHWFNVYDSTDLIASPLGPDFKKPGYAIHDIYVDIADDPVGSHDYFHNQTTLHLIAAVLR